jgi:uncharacterized protein YwqG
MYLSPCFLHLSTLDFYRWLLSHESVILKRQLENERLCATLLAIIGSSQRAKEEDTMDKADVEAAFRAAGLSRLLKDIDSITKPAIRLSATPVDEAALARGASKLGGVPDLLPGISWPDWKGLPQSFIGQIRLADVRPYDVNHVLPPDGMLWFFYDAKQETYGDNPADRGGWRVLFSSGDLSGLQRCNAPAALPPASLFHAGSLSFASELILSQFPEMEIPHFDWTTDEQHRYETLLSNLRSPAERSQPEHQLLGFPDAIQDDMRLECQLASHGVSDPDSAQAAQLAKGAMDWQLLLQIDSDDRLGMRWGDNGLIYYWITSTNMQSCHFDESWLVLQSE